MLKQLKLCHGKMHKEETSDGKNKNRKLEKKS